MWPYVGRDALVRSRVRLQIRATDELGAGRAANQTPPHACSNWQKISTYMFTPPLLHFRPACS